MKSSTHHSFPDRRAFVAAGMSLLIGAATAVAQTPTSSSSNPTPGDTTRQAETTDTTRADPSSSYSTPRGASASQDSNTRPQSSATAEGQPTIDGAYGTTATTGAANSANSADSSTRSSTYGTTDTSTTGGATTMTGRESARLGWMERRFVNKAADAGMTEISLAKLALEKSSNPEVKRFAQTLVDDHTKVSDELKTLAGQKNVKLDEEDLGSDRAHKRLSKKSGMEFDQEFVEHMVDMHESDVKLFEKYSTDAKDPDLKSFAAKHVDHLRQHLQTAQSLRSSIIPTGRTDDDTSTRGASATSIDASSSTTTGATGTTSTTGSTSSDSSSTSTPSSTTPGASTYPGTSSSSSTTSDPTNRDRTPRNP